MKKIEFKQEDELGYDIWYELGLEGELWDEFRNELWKDLDWNLKRPIIIIS